MTDPLERLKVAAEVATPGPWYRDGSNYRNVWTQDDGPLVTASACGRTTWNRDEDAHFVVLAQPQTVLALVRVAEAAKAATAVPHGVTQPDFDRLADALREVREALKVLDLPKSIAPS